MGKPAHGKLRKRDWALIALLFHLLLAGVIVFEYFQQRGHESLPNTREITESACTRRLQDGLAKTQNRCSPKAKPQETVEHPKQPAEPKPRAVEQAPQVISIRFENIKGTYVAGFRFRFAALDQDALTKLQAAGRAALTSPEERCPLEATGSQAGTIELRQGVDFEGTAVVIRMISAMSNVGFDGKGDSGMELLPDEFAFVVPTDGAWKSIRLIPTRRIFPTVMYSDKQPFVGKMEVSVDSPAWPGLSGTRGVEFAEGKRPYVDLPRVPSAIEFTIWSEREGYETRMWWDYDYGDLAQSMLFTIPIAGEKTLVSVNFEKWTADEPIEVSVCSASGSRQPVKWWGGKTWVTNELKPAYFAKCFIRAKGASGIWQSETFTVEVGQPKYFTAAPAKAFTLRTRFIDQDGNVLTRAVVSTQPDIYPNWATREVGRSNEDVGRGEAFTANAGKLGIAELTGLFPGTFQASFEAFGFEPVTRWITGKAGELVDIGDIMLEAAKGRVEVNLLNGEPDRAYDLSLYGSASGSTVADVRKTKEPQVVFEHLARRPYVLFVAASDHKGHAVNLRVEFVGDTVVLNVDLRDLND